MDDNVKAQVDGLFDDTIQPALAEDFEFKSKLEAKRAINRLIESLKAMKRDLDGYNIHIYDGSEDD